MIIQIGIFALICVIAIFLAIFEFYKIPKIETVSRIFEHSNIYKLTISTKFFGISNIELTKEISSVELIEPELIPESVIKTEPSEPKQVEIIKSELVGIFFLINDETGLPFITIGKNIKSGDKLGFITAMHIPTDVVSSTDGQITDMLIENGMPIEYGQAIIRVEIT